MRDADTTHSRFHRPSTSGARRLPRSDLHATAGPAAAQVTDAAFACQRTVGKATAKYVKSHTACQAKCIQRARKGAVSFFDCQVPPNADLDTQTCLGTLFTGPPEKAVAAIVKACTGPNHECPSCYGSCSQFSYPAASIFTHKALTGSILNQIQCNLPDTPAVGKCMDATGKAYAKDVAAVTKCHEKCRVNDRKGTTDGSCEAPASDSVTAACVAMAETKTALAIDKKGSCRPPFRPRAWGGRRRARPGSMLD